MAKPFHRMEIRSQLGHLPEARRFVREFCRRDACRQLAREERWKLELAVHEVGANIIRHAYGNRPDQPILIEMEAFTERVMVHINHWGTSFRQMKSASPPVLEGSAKCGFGLYLIESCVDQVTYACYPDGKNTISLLKYMSGIIGGTGMGVPQKEDQKHES